MLATIRKILAYLDWLSLIAFIVVFGICLIPKTMVGAIITFIVALAVLLIMFEESSKTYSPKRRVSYGKPLGNPLIDIALGVFAFQGLMEETTYRTLFLAGLIMVGIDLLLWGVNFIQQQLHNR
ncbi:MAG: hypothetical protein K2H60_12040 [Muribaculaceae bacterium]|nr:hypothetical protein [Muribaculaceae bacterium]